MRRGHRGVVKPQLLKLRFLWLPRVVGVDAQKSSAGHLSTQFEVPPDRPPRPRVAQTLAELRATFSGSVQLHRFPCAAVFDRVGWKGFDRLSSITQAKEFARRFRRPGPNLTDLCADGTLAFPLGAPPALVDYAVSWGGVSCFLPVGKLGWAAWRYAHETLALLHKSDLPCHVTHDPSALLGSGLVAPRQLRYVFDRSIGRSWADLSAAGIARPADRSQFAADEASWAPLAHHVLVTVSEAAPTALLDRVALCEGWDACLPAAYKSSWEDGPGAPPAAGSLCIQEQLLSDVERVLDDGLVHEHVPRGLCVEALLYSFLFHHQQARFSGRAGLDRALGLDGGRCAELVLAAAERAWPGGDFGRDAWAAGSYAPTIVSAARSLIERRDRMGEEGAAGSACATGDS